MHYVALGLHLCLGFLVAQWSHGAWLGNICAGRGGARCCAGPPAYAFQEAISRDVHPRFPAELDGIWVPPASFLGLTKSHIFLL